jgi:hypothetical protein
MVFTRRRLRQVPQRHFHRPGLEALEDRTLLSAPSWNGYANDPQHTGISAVPAVALDFIRWKTPVDLNPQYSGGDLLIHYGSPLVTPANTVIVPVKTGATDGFRVEAHNGVDGSLKWMNTTDYILPTHGWTPSYSPTLTPLGRLYFPGSGGRVYYINSPDADGAVVSGAYAFYPGYDHSQDSTVFISTPITSDNAGNIYFGFQVTGSTNQNLKSGLARISAGGVPTWVAATTAAGDSTVSKIGQNSAPALSNDGNLVYIAVNGSGPSYLLALNSTTLATVSKVALKDVLSGKTATVPDDGTASPTVGPDGDVYFGVLENPFPENHDRGWLLHFDHFLVQQKLSGAFGWDDTASIVPSSMVPAYNGPSSYLLMTKYNNYAGVGGDGHNKLAVLDPNTTEIDPITGAVVMREVYTILGQTPDPDFPNKPGAVREWCINTAGIDPATKSILANSEDGRLYRWDMTTNTFSQSITLTTATGEAYTPVVIGVNGTVYAVNNATLFAVQTAATVTVVTSSANPSGAGQPVTFTAHVSNVIPGYSPPPGQITFYDQGQYLGTFNLDSGIASVTTAPTPGNHTITAVYSGSNAGNIPALPSVGTAKQAVRLGPSLFAIGGSPGLVQIRRVSDGGLIAEFAPFGPFYTGGVNVAVGDIANRGYEDLVVAADTGNPDVRVYDGQAITNGTFNPVFPDASLLAQWFPYGLNFNVGATVAVGDVSNNGFLDIITGADVGNPDVRVYSGKDIANHVFNPYGYSLLAQWFPYALQFNVGANVAAGDLNGDGYADVVTGATAGNPDVRAYDGKAIATGGFSSGNPDASRIAQFFAFGLNFNVGATVAVGDVNGDGFNDILVGASAGNPQVKAYNGEAIAAKTFATGTAESNVITSFFAYGLNFNVGANVAAGEFDTSGKAEILTGATGGAPHYRVVPGNASGVMPPALPGLEGIPPDFDGGISVGA